MECAYRVYVPPGALKNQPLTQFRTPFCVCTAARNVHAVCKARHECATRVRAPRRAKMCVLECVCVCVSVCVSAGWRQLCGVHACCVCARVCMRSRLSRLPTGRHSELCPGQHHLVSARTRAPCAHLCMSVHAYAQAPISIPSMHMCACVPPNFDPIQKCF